MITRTVFVGAAATLVIALAATTAAQTYEAGPSYAYGPCAYVPGGCGPGGCRPGGYCPGGACTPNTGNFGYYQTGWRRWPTSAPVAPRVDDSDTPFLDTLPPAETPAPQFEGDIDPRRGSGAGGPTEPRLPPLAPPMRDPPAEGGRDSDPTWPPFELPNPRPEPDDSSNDVLRMRQRFEQSRQPRDPQPIATARLANRSTEMHGNSTRTAAGPAIAQVNLVAGPTPNWTNPFRLTSPASTSHSQPHTPSVALPPRGAPAYRQPPDEALPAAQPRRFDAAKEQSATQLPPPKRSSEPRLPPPPRTWSHNPIRPANNRSSIATGGPEAEPAFENPLRQEGSLRSSVANPLRESAPPALPPLRGEEGDGGGNRALLRNPLRAAP